MNNKRQKTIWNTLMNEEELGHRLGMPYFHLFGKHLKGDRRYCSWCDSPDDSSWIVKKLKKLR